MSNQKTTEPTPPFVGTTKSKTTLSDIRALDDEHDFSGLLRSEAGDDTTWEAWLHKYSFPRQPFTDEICSTKFGMTKKTLNDRILGVSKRWSELLSDDSRFQTFEAACRDLSRSLGAGVPLTHVEWADRVDGSLTDVEVIALWRAGPYILRQDRKHDWITLSNQNPRRAINALLRRKWDNWWMHPDVLSMTMQEHLVPVAAEEKVAETLGLTLRKINSRGDKGYVRRGCTSAAACALVEIGEPATPDTIFARMAAEEQTQFTVKQVKERFLCDDNFVRTAKKKWALKDWGYTPYRSIAHDIIARLEANDGQPMLHSELVKTISEEREVAPQSVNTYLTAGAFQQSADGWVTLATEPPEEVPKMELEDAENLTLLSDTLVSIELTVNSLMLGGGGTPLPNVLYRLLGLRDEHKRWFKSEHQDILIYWSPTSIVPVLTGSLRTMLKALNVAENDTVALQLDVENNTATINSTN